MPLLPPDALLRRLDLALRQRMEGTAAGEARAFGVQGGLELDRVRAWEPGDDWRLIDPAATARTGEPHVRVQVAERRITLWLAVDVSSSMAFGTRACEKTELAVASAAVFGLIGLRQAAQIGSLPLGDGSEHPTPPRSGRPALLGMLERLAAVRDGLEGDLGASLTKLDRIVSRRSVVVVVSDFRAQTDRWRAPLTRLAARHETICIEVSDAREDDLPDVGVVRFLDPETQRSHTVDTASTKIRARFAERAAARREDTRSAIASSGADLIRVQTESDWLTHLVRQLDQRRRRRWVSASR